MLQFDMAIPFHSSKIHCHSFLFLVASARLSIQHCYREANQVAHCLAREAFITQDSCIWGDDPFQVGLAMLLIHVSR
jgi:hypothetical protein